MHHNHSKQSKVRVGLQIREQSRDKRTKQGRSIARFDCDGGAPVSCGGCGEERGDAQVGNESRSGGIEGLRKDSNLAGMLLSNSVGSEPLCEMASEWTPMPQPLVVDSGAAETIIPRMWFPSHKTAESEGSKRGVFYTKGDGSNVEKEREATLIMSTADAGQLRKWTFQVRNVKKARGSVSMMVRNGNRVVFHTSGSDIENKMTKEILWLRERDGVYVVDMMVAPPGREQQGTPPFGRRGM